MSQQTLSLVCDTLDALQHCFEYYTDPNHHDVIKKPSLFKLFFKSFSSSQYNHMMFHVEIINAAEKFINMRENFPWLFVYWGANDFVRKQMENELLTIQISQDKEAIQRTLLSILGHLVFLKTYNPNELKNIDLHFWFGLVADL